MPRGGGNPDLSQRPRREAPGMLTGVAILERELGLIDYAKHQVEKRLRAKLSADEARRLRAETQALEARRQATLAKLDELNEELEQRRELRRPG